MAVKSLNKAQLIGNLTKDPELKYTPQGTAVVTFSVATNRQWNDSSGQQKDEVTFHRVVAWAKLAEIIGQYLKKGMRVFIEGRISNRDWEDKQGQKHYMTEIVADDMIILTNKNDAPAQNQAQSNNQVQDIPDDAPPEPEDNQEANPDDIPF